MTQLQSLKSLKLNAEIDKKNHVMYSSTQSKKLLNYSAADIV